MPMMSLVGVEQTESDVQGGAQGTCRVSESA